MVFILCDMTRPRVACRTSRPWKECVGTGMPATNWARLCRNSKPVNNRGGLTMNGVTLTVGVAPTRMNVQPP